MVSRIHRATGWRPCKRGGRAVSAGDHSDFAARLSRGALGELCRVKPEASGVELTLSVIVDLPATPAIARLDAGGAAGYDL